MKNSRPTILVTGGAGYIGSHVLKLLTQRGESVVILDDLSTGNKEAVVGAPLKVGNFGNTTLLHEIFNSFNITTVFHFAAFIDVEESVRNPLSYYQNNVSHLISLLEFCKQYEVTYFIYSSSAAVYGIVNQATVSEDHPTKPINPYGETKLIGEWLVRNVGSQSSMKTACLRYFNVAGADPDGQLGQSSTTAKHLIKAALQTALGKKKQLEIFGNDYNTPDGTALRDYIHVSDLASAHLAALDFISDKNESLLINCGYGTGYSVLDVIHAVERVTGVSLPKIYSPRRAGDPASLVADCSQLNHLLQWKPQYNDLEFIVKTAYEWECKLQKEKIAHL